MIFYTRRLDYAIWTIQLCIKYNINIDIFVSLVQTESDWKNTSTGIKGVIGLVQWNTNVWKFEDLNPYNDKDNLEAGCRILKFYLDKYNGNYLKALHAYKSISPLGLKQAKYVLQKANNEW